MIVSYMREYGISLLATSDADFERVPAISIFKPTDLRGTPPNEATGVSSGTAKAFNVPARC
jgi:hypothetical protein